MVKNSELSPIGDFARAYARAVKAAVDAKGISGSDLGRRMSRAQSYVSLRLNGRKAWTLDELDTIARILGTTPGALLDQARNK